VQRLGYGVNNFLILRPYYGEHGPKVPVIPEYTSFCSACMRKRELCISILTKSSNKYASCFKWFANQRYLNNSLSIIFAAKVQTLLAALFQKPPSYAVKVLHGEHKCSPFYLLQIFLTFAALVR
jgi:hypothetical protein